MAVVGPSVTGAVSGEFLLAEPAALSPVLQPVIDLDDGGVAGYEALARVRHGYPQLTPDQMFRWARRNDRTNELDWMCRCAAFRIAIEQRVSPPMPLLVNAEPAALDSGAPAALLADLQRARRQLRVVVELTERELADDPGQLFRVVDSMRALGWEIAVDDVGAEPISLALLPLLEPDIIKLDRSLIVDPTTPDHARIALAVAAEMDRTGASVIVEGVETVEQLEIARAWGARYAQGFLWGRPARNARTDLASAPLPPGYARSPSKAARQCGASASRRLVGDGELDALVQILLAAAATDQATVAIARWPSGLVADPWRRELARLARDAAFVGSATSDNESCDVVVLSPSMATALSAQQTRPAVWEVTVIHARSEVIGRAQQLIRTVTRTGAVLSHRPVPLPRAASRTVVPSGHDDRSAPA
jgi:EAL domain-containing protein (putative c-di-GMP-specific phosphodiesterase class I)